MRRHRLARWCFVGVSGAWVLVFVLTVLSYFVTIEMPVNCVDGVVGIRRGTCYYIRAFWNPFEPRTVREKYNCPWEGTWYFALLRPQSLLGEFECNTSRVACSTALPCVILCPVLLAWSWLLWKRRAGGCTTCGYDLTGNASGVCPECGTPVAESDSV
ncbi:MAG: hypothetical protein PVJ57_09970 [Phycisphaerae bacterium]|jgi:hypothetical protein